MIWFLGYFALSAIFTVILCRHLHLDKVANGEADV